MANRFAFRYGNASRGGCWLGERELFHDTEIPYVRLCERPWRPLKTISSKRDVPLVGVALWAAQRAYENSPNDYLLPRYCSEDGCTADYASNSLNKWMKPFVPDRCFIHSFRPSLRDRLRVFECPSDIIDQIGGWKTAGVGQYYGTGFELDVLFQWMKKLNL